ncbi:unnamed protein product [Soboliphyme baturini]|uniref:BMP-binding endothelial regulator protein n=1 Tax=Soboliphyme baturini TaxID=241478 RepID=A0A183IMQ8_9BILA|nr:unnamed protein product [Soboliphyme baturini]
MRVITSKGGVVTGARIQCVTTCNNPERFVGFCCPVCPRCTMVFTLVYQNNVFDQVLVSASNLTAPSSVAELTTMQDPCVQCQCDTHWCHCFRTACPVLDCVPNLQYTPENACCPECKVPREEKLTDHTCIFQDKEYQYDQSFRPDPCTLCVCQDSQVWKMDSCTKCKCSNGKVICNTATCPHSFGCPRGYKMKTVPGQCCSKCVEKEATCTVFGDPHYQTFDGREFSFQGSCRYVLTEECVLDPERENWSPFTVIVANELRSNDSYSWTRHVSIRLARDIRVALLPGKKVKINRRLVALPYVELGLFSIMFDKSYNVLMRANIGLKIVWDGNSYAEVTVTPNYKGRLCGLCGNYNHNAKDDFVTKSGFLVTKAQDGRHFGSVRWKRKHQSKLAWKMLNGGSKVFGAKVGRDPDFSVDQDESLSAEAKATVPVDAAPKSNDVLMSENDGVTDYGGNDFPETTTTQKSSVILRHFGPKTPCEKNELTESCFLLKSALFALCHSVVPVHSYLKSCIIDSCACPPGHHCFCESLLAYARRCKREGVSIEWQLHAKCYFDSF